MEKIRFLIDIEESNVKVASKGEFGTIRQRVGDHWCYVNCDGQESKIFSAEEDIEFEIIN